LAAEFGIPVLLAALLFAVMLFRDLLKLSKTAQSKEELFLSRAAVLALVGYLVAGLFEYTYGHSLGLILLSFAVLSPLLPSTPPIAQSSRSMEFPGEVDLAHSRNHASL